MSQTREEHAEVLELLPHRILEQVEPWTRWFRRSWEGGTILALEELSEVFDWVPRKVISAASADSLRQRIRSSIGRDPGIGSGVVKKQLEELTRSPIKAGSQRHRQYDQLVALVKSQYLDNWAMLVEKHPEALHLERASRYLASAALDVGYDQEWLRKTLKPIVRAGSSAVEIVQQLALLVKTKPSLITGLVALTSLDERLALEKLDQWLPEAEVVARLSSWNQRYRGEPIVGGIEFQIEALEPATAARLVAERLSRLESQIQFNAFPSRLRYEPKFFTPMGSKPLQSKRKGITLASSSATEKLTAAAVLHHDPSLLDDALQMAAPLVSGTDTIAATSAWAVIESLLSSSLEEDDRSRGKSDAADRAASIVAASWPRAELAPVAHRLADAPTTDARLMKLLAVSSESQARARVLFEWLEAGHAVEAIGQRDRAAVLRMQQLIADPQETLRRVRGYMGGAFHRLYRQRNLILHGGSLRPIAMAASLQTAGPLVAAALDQMIHASELHGVVPLDLSARAEVALKGAGDDSSWSLVDLLSF